MFLLNVGHQWNLASQVNNVAGVIFLPSGNTSERLTRADVPEFQRVLFDPQLYLSGLDSKSRETVCARLATYPWFLSANIPEFDSGETTRSKWEKDVKERIEDCWLGILPQGAEIAEACRTALEFQLNLSCSHVILPSPLIDQREDEALIQATWLDAGLAEARNLDIGQPLLFTIALDELILNDAAFAAGGFLDIVVDQVTAREGLEGVYIVVAQTHAEHPNATDRRVLRAYLRLSKAFSDAGYSAVITNYAGVFGLVCIGAGATGVACGASHNHRRLSLNGFQDSGGGTPLPKFYSHRSSSEFLTETELNPIVARKLLRRVEDTTPYSQSLMETLAEGHSAEDVKAWAESRGNLTTAQMHFLWRLANEVGELAKHGSKKRRSKVRDWLEDADANITYLRRRFEEADEELQGALAPVDKWLELLDEL